MTGLLVCLGGAFLYAIVFRAANRLVYQPSRYPEGWWEIQEELGARDVWLRTRDELTLHAWYVPSPDDRLVTLYLHGNGGNISMRPGHLREIEDAGSSVLILDYRGYGRSEGRPSERGLYRDADAAYDYLVAEGWRAEQIVIHGESLGSAVAVDLAARKACAGLILECPITSVTEMAGRVAPVLGPLFVFGYNARRKIARVHVPIMIVHGDADRTVPHAMGRRLFTTAREPKTFWTVAGAHHMDIVAVAGSLYRERLRSFYDSAGREARAGEQARRAQ